MPKQPLFPHVPKSRQPLFPHVPKSQQVVLPQTEKTSTELKYFWVEKNLPYDTWAIVEAWPGGTVRSPFKTKEEAVKQEEEIAEGIWTLKQVPSPQEKFPKQHEALKKLYPYEFIEYHDDGDLTIQLLVPPQGRKWPVSFRELVKGDVMVVTTDGLTFKQVLLDTIELLAKTEGDPIRKFCCRQCGECVPPELLEEGRFPDRIAWLRSHYKAKHHSMWGKGIEKLPQVMGEPIPPEYRDLVSPTGPLPKDVI